MISLSFKSREKNNETSEGFILGILYGPGINNIILEVESKGIEKVYKETGGSSLISLESTNQSEKNKYKVLIHDIQRDHLNGKITHVDFYQPNLKEEVEVTIPLVFEGEPPAVKELGGTFVKNILEVDVRALPEKLPHDIKVNVEGLKTFEDVILIKDLKVYEGVEILKDPEETVALVTPIQDIEEDLEKPIDEDVESIEKVETKKEKEEDNEEEKEEKKE